MSDRPDASNIPRPYRCGQYRPGHDVHYIQARKSSELSPTGEAFIHAIADNGTITFADGSTRWNHDPVRLRAIVDERGADLTGTTVLSAPDWQSTFLPYDLERPGAK